MVTKAHQLATGPIVLGSGSPRRAELLRQIGVPFEVVVSSIDEARRDNESPDQYVERMAREKMVAVRKLVAENSRVVLCADTIVTIDQEVFAKPLDRADGLNMLLLLSGRPHRVVTAVAMAAGDEICQFAVETIVHFRQLSMDEAEDYWASGEPLDKAGGYGIQGLGAVLVERITGSYSNVVGLPLLETFLALRRFGVDCLALAGQQQRQNLI